MHRARKPARNRLEIKRRSENEREHRWDITKMRYRNKQSQGYISKSHNRNDNRRQKTDAMCSTEDNESRKCR